MTLNSSWFKRIRALIVASAFLPFAACALSGGPIDGLVVEEGTNRPIADAIVVFRWRGSLTKFLESSSWCYHVESTRTDAQGRFHIKFWWMPISILTLRTTDSYVDFMAYKPGYIWSTLSPLEQERIVLTPFTGTARDHFNFLKRASLPCNRTDPSERYLYPLYAAITEEASAIAQTPDDKQFVRSMAHRTQESLVNFSKPVKPIYPTDNIDPADRYKIEDLDK